MSIFIKIPGISGNVTSEGHKGWIAAYSAHVKAERPIHTTPGRVSDRDSSIPVLSELEVNKGLDGASNDLFNAACSGKVFDQVDIDLCHTGKSLEPYAKYVLYNVMVSEVSTAMFDQGNPAETVRFNYTKLQSTYIQRDSTGRAQAPHTVGYDQETAKIL